MHLLTTDERLAKVADEDFSRLLDGARTVGDLTVPNDYQDSVTFVADTLYRAKPAVRERFGRLVLTALPQAILAARGAAGAAHLFDLLFAFCACRVRDAGAVGGVLAAPLADDTLRRRPSPETDVHRQLLLTLAAHGPRLADHPKMLEVVQADSGDPDYAAAAFAALLAHDPGEAVTAFPRVLRVFTTHKIPTRMLVQQTARRLLADRALWRRLGAALGRGPAEDVAARQFAQFARREHDDGFADAFLEAREGQATAAAVRRGSTGLTRRGVRRTLVGVVTRDKMQKTRRVEIQRLAKHRRYSKYIKRRTVCYVHDENNETRTGDTVEIMETRPLSKNKNWRLVRIVKKAPGGADPLAGAVATEPPKVRAGRPPTAPKGGGAGTPSKVRTPAV